VLGVDVEVTGTVALADLFLAAHLTWRQRRGLLVELRLELADVVAELGTLVHRRRRLASQRLARLFERAEIELDVEHGCQPAQQGEREVGVGYRQVVGAVAEEAGAGDLQLAKPLDGRRLHARRPLVCREGYADGFQAGAEARL